MSYQTDTLKSITVEREVSVLEEASKLNIKKLGLQDLETFKELIEIFKMNAKAQSKKEIDEFSLNTMLRHVTFVGFVAIENEQVIGGLTGYSISSYYKGESEFFLYNLAVKPTFTGKGIGKKLVNTILKYAKESGHSRLFVGAQIEGNGGEEFYRNTGAKEYQVSKFVYDLK